MHHLTDNVNIPHFLGIWIRRNVGKHCEIAHSKPWKPSCQCSIKCKPLSGLIPCTKFLFSRESLYYPVCLVWCFLVKNVKLFEHTASTDFTIYTKFTKEDNMLLFIQWTVIGYFFVTCRESPQTPSKQTRSVMRNFIKFVTLSMTNPFFDYKNTVSQWCSYLYIREGREGREGRFYCQCYPRCMLMPGINRFNTWRLYTVHFFV